MDKLHFMPNDDTPRVVRVLIQPTVTEDDVGDLAMSLGWVPLGTRPRSEQNPYAFVWEDEDNAVQVHYIDDDLLNMAYLYLRGDGIEATERAIRSHLPAWAYHEVVDRLAVAAGPDDVIDAVCKIAVSREPETAEVRKLLADAVRTGDPAVRRAVITAAGYLEWSSLLELARQLRETDPDDEVREEAALVLNAIASGRG